MRSTRAAAAVARLHRRIPACSYGMTITSSGLFFLSEQKDSGEEQLCEAMPLDDFVRAVDAMGPQQVRRLTKSDAAFEKQLFKKPIA